MPFLTNIRSCSRFPMHFLLTCRRLQLIIIIIINIFPFWTKRRSHLLTRSLHNAVAAAEWKNIHFYFIFLKAVLFKNKTKPQFWQCIFLSEHAEPFYSKFFVTIMTGRHIGKVFVLNSSYGGRWGGCWGPKIPLLAPKRAILSNRGQKTAHRAAQRALTRKPKVSRVTSGHGEDMIPLSQVCQGPKKWVMWA